MEKCQAIVDLSEYPKHVELDDGTQVLLRPMRRDDRDRLWVYVDELPAYKRRYFKHEAIQSKVISNWCQYLDYDRVLPILAIVRDGGHDRVVADSSLHTENHGWSVHVARIQWTVADDMLNRGLGRFLVCELLDRANIREIRKIRADVHAEDKQSIQLLLRLGFKQEAVFKKHAMDQRGRLHDVTIFAYDFDQQWQKMDDLNIDSDFCQKP